MALSTQLRHQEPTSLIQVVLGTLVMEIVQACATGISTYHMSNRAPRKNASNVMKLVIMDVKTIIHVTPPATPATRTVQPAQDQDTMNVLHATATLILMTDAVHVTKITWAKHTTVN